MGNLHYSHRQIHQLQLQNEAEEEQKEQKTQHKRNPVYKRDQATKCNVTCIQKSLRHKDFSLAEPEGHLRSSQVTVFSKLVQTNQAFNSSPVETNECTAQLITGH